MSPPVPCRGRGVVTAPGESCQEGHLWNPSSALSLSFDIPEERNQLGSQLAPARSRLFLFPRKASGEAVIQGPQAPEILCFRLLSKRKHSPSLWKELRFTGDSVAGRLGAVALSSLCTTSAWRR